MNRKCDVCGNKYNADERNLKRGWGLCCSKSCAAKKRERSRPSYNTITVAINNERRYNWNRHDEERYDNIADYYDGIDFLCDCGDR